MPDEFDYVKPSRPMPNEILPLEDILRSMRDMEAEETNFVGCFYGEAGSGKTTTTMKFAQLITPPDKKILYYGTGQGHSSLKNFPELMLRTKYEPYKDADQFESIIHYLKQDKIRERLGIGTIVFDEHNTMVDLEIERITATRSAQVWADKHQFKDPDTPEWPDYNSAKVKLINSLNHVLQTDELNLIFACHPRIGKKSFKIEPDYFDKAAQAFLRAMHSVYYIQRDEVLDKVTNKVAERRTIRLQGTDQITAKNRIGGLPNVVSNVEPIAEAYLKWREGKKAEKNPVVSTAVENVETSGGESVAPQDNVVALKKDAGQEDGLMSILNIGNK